MLFQTIFSTDFKQAKQQAKAYSQVFVFNFLIIWILLCISHLCTGIMSDNEVGKLMLAKQFVFPDWLPNDWYLSQPQKYQALFQLFFGQSILNIGFVATSILGRLIYYSLIALGLVLIAKEIQLRLLGLVIALILFLLSHQGVAIAGEWMIGGLETKGFAYGLILIAIWLAMKQRYVWMTASLGLATSFHILVGGYATLTFVPWLLWKAFQDKSLNSKVLQKYTKKIFLCLLIYGLTSSFATVALLNSLSETVIVPDSKLQATYIYTFLRNSHHLTPTLWAKIRFPIIGFYLSTLCWCWQKIRREKYSITENFTSEIVGQKNRLLFLELTFFSLIPLFFGLGMSLIDTQGKILQYYPFRFGSLMLALSTLLIPCYSLQFYIDKVNLSKNIKKRLVMGALLVLMGFHSFTFIGFVKSAIALINFPMGVEENHQASQAMFTWIQENIDQEEIIISSPGRYVGFNWLTNHATVAKFKLVPPTETQILKWYARLNDLAGYPEDYVWHKTGFAMEEELHQGYQNLSTDQVKILMQKYQSQYFFDARDHLLDLPIAYENNGYRLYQRDY